MVCKPKRVRVKSRLSVYILYFYRKGHFMTYMLFAGWEVRIVKNCDRSLENAAFSSPRSRFFTIRTDPKPVNNLVIFCLSLKRREKTHASVTVTVVRDRKIRTALRTNQIAEFVTVTAWKKIMCNIIIDEFSSLQIQLCQKVNVFPLWGVISLFIDFFDRERAVSWESCNLIGSGSGQYFPICWPRSW